MATITPFRFRRVLDRMLITNEAGDYDFFAPDVIDRFFAGSLSTDEHQALRNLSVLVEEDEEEWRLSSLMRRIREAHTGHP